MEQNNIPRVQFLVVFIVMMLSCTTAVDNVRRNYIIADGENEKELIVRMKDDNVDLYLKLTNLADSLLLLCNGKQYVDAGAVKLEVLSEEVTSVAEQDLTFTSYYLIVDNEDDRQFYWGVNVNREETIYFTNPDGEKILKLISKTNGKRTKNFLEPLDYIKNKYLKAPPMPSPPKADDLDVK